MIDNDLLYHWAPAKCRRSINRYGLRPTTATSASMTFADLIDSYSEGHARIHYDIEDQLVCFKAICFSFDPAKAWALSGACTATPGSRWDLWMARINETDIVYPEPSLGFRMQEVRVANRIPKSRVWHVGLRVVKSTWETKGNER